MTFISSCGDRQHQPASRVEKDGLVVTFVPKCDKDEITLLAQVLNAIIAASVMLLGCSAADPEDAWLHFRPAEDVHSQAWEEVPRERIHKISPENTNVARNLLERESARELDEGQAKLFVGGSPALGYRFFLVRAVRPVTPNSDITAFTGDRSIATEGGALTKEKRLSIERTPIVVELRDSPERVYVEASIVE